MADFSSPLIPAALPCHGGGSINVVVVAGDHVNPAPLNRTRLFREVLRSMSGRIEKLYLSVRCFVVFSPLTWAIEWNSQAWSRRTESRQSMCSCRE